MTATNGIADTGTRAGGYGQTLVSCGHLDLDRILGGGLPLGSLLLTFEDEWTSHHVTLAKLFLAEGAVCGHVGFVFTFEGGCGTNE